MKRGGWGVNLALGLSLIASASSSSRATGDFQAWVDGAREREPSGVAVWRPGTWRIAAAGDRSRRGRLHLVGPRWKRIESWVAGHLAVHWAQGASGFPAAAGPVAALAGAASGGAGSGRMVGAGMRFRAGPGTLLLAAGHRRDEPTAIVAWTQGGGGLLLAGKPGTARRLVADPVASLALSHRARGRRGEVELALAGGRPSLAAHVAADRAGLAVDLDFDLPGSGDTRPAGGPALDLRVRSSPGGVRTVLGARAELGPPPGSETDGVPSQTQKVASSRSWLEALVPLSSMVGGVDVLMRGELRHAAGRDRSRLHAELRTPLSRAAADWIGEGGLLLRLRTVWSLPAGFALETGAAAWSGPVAETGASADLPGVPEHGLAPRLSRPGQAASFLINWQRGGVRVRLGLSARQAHHASSESRIASRMDLALPGIDGR